MANNCLVTKLKGEVVNENLPIFGKVVINFTKTAAATADQKFFVIGGGASNPCHVKLNNLSISSGRYAGLTEFDIPANTTPTAFSVDSLNNDNMSMELSCYEISALQCNAPVSSITGLDSIQYSSKAVRIKSPSDAINRACENCKNIEAILTYYHFGSVDRNTKFAARNKDTLKVFTGVIYPEGISGNTLIQKCSLAGDVINYPATIKSIYINNIHAQVTGSITALVEKFRAAGRTSGKIEANWLGSTDDVTIDDGNGNEIGTKTYITNKGIAPADHKMYLTWDADSVDITKDATGAEAYIDIYGNNA